MTSRLKKAAITMAMLGLMGFTSFSVAFAADATTGYKAAMSAMMHNMMMAPTSKPELDFVQGMIPHHEGAVAMAKIELQFGKDAAIKKMAENVVKAQESEIVVMKDWLSKADQAKLPVVAESAKANSDAMAAMMKNMENDYLGNADVDFVKGMIPHHQGAIEMARVAKQYVKDPALLKLADDITSAQEGEITFMQDWLKKNGS